MSIVADGADSVKEGAKRALVERPHSRRTILTGAAVGLAGAAVAAVGTAKPAGADGPNILLGNGQGAIGNDAGTGQTSMTTDASAPAFIVYNTASDGTGIYGQTANGSGLSVGPAAVVGDSKKTQGIGVAGVSLSGPGVVGQSQAPSGFLDNPEIAGVIGDSQNNIGVCGFSMNGPGVQGASDNSTGVLGVTAGNGGSAVSGFDFSPTGATGVFGQSGAPGGVGVSAENSSGTALKVTGIATFSRSGVVSIAAGKSTATHTGVSPLKSTSLVLANLQNSLPGVYVEAVVPNVSGHSFEIVLSKAVPAGKTAKVAWFIVN